MFDVVNKISKYLHDFFISVQVPLTDRDRQMRTDYSTRCTPPGSAPEGGGRGSSLGGGVALADQLPERAGAFLWRDPGR